MISRKNSFLIIVIAASLIIGGLIGFYFYTKTKNPAPASLGGTSRGRGFSNYNPDGATSTPTTPDELSISTSTPTVDVVVPRLRKISDVPVAGANFVNIDIIGTSTKTTGKNIEPADGTVAKVVIQTPKIIGSQELIRFIERGTGNIYETSTSTAINTRISNTTIPKIYEAFFFNKGDNLILRDLVGSTDILRTRYASLQLSTTTENERNISMLDLPINSNQIAKSPSGASLFSLYYDGVRGVISKPDGGSKVGIFNSPFKEWLVSWPREQSIVLTTKPSGFVPGYAYALDTKNRSFTRLLGDIPGLTTLPSSDMSKILFSKSSGGSFDLGLFTQKDSSQKDLSLRTLPEKCVWAKTEADVVYCAVPSNIAFNTYPDVWYQGLITFSDDIWKINVVTGEYNLLISPQDVSGEIVDVINPEIDSKDDYLIFTNKIDLSLWGLRLKEPVKPVSTANPAFLTATSTMSYSTTTTTTKITATSTIITSTSTTKR